MVLRHFDHTKYSTGSNILKPRMQEQEAVQPTQIQTLDSAIVLNISFTYTQYNAMVFI